MSTAEQKLAQSALAQLETSALAVLKTHTGGLRTGEVARILGIETHCPTENSNWLARCVLENLVSQGRAVSEKKGSARVFHAL